MCNFFDVLNLLSVCLADLSQACGNTIMYIRT